MFTLVEALNYRCLRYISQPLGPFHLLVGANGSGKTTFLDVISFLGEVANDRFEQAISDRTENSNYEDLTWRREGNHIELALEAAIPASLLRKDSENHRVRYEISFGILPKSNSQLAILSEKLCLKPMATKPDAIPALFPSCSRPPDTILSKHTRKGWQTIFSKTSSGLANYAPERSSNGSDWKANFNLGLKRSGLANLPEDLSKFPVAVWFRNELRNSIRNVVLNSALMRKPSAPRQQGDFRTDGSNLPWVVESLKHLKTKGQGEEVLRQWSRHVKSAIPDFVQATTTLRDEDRHRYLNLHYDNNLTVPSWLASDGTLRMLALTILAYIPDLKGVYLIEEPENGIHPRAVEAVFESLSSVYSAQILMASHSPLVVGLAKPEQILCFAKTEEGQTDIVAGHNHPQLQDWHDDISLGSLLASGVLS